MSSSTEESLRTNPFLRDGFEVHSAALACGFNVTLLPRQSLMVSAGASLVGDGSFVHGVPQASSVAAVTLAQDKRIRRALLQRRGLRVPQGATFSIGRGAGSARAYARRLGYPVVVKPAMGDNTIGVMSGIRDEAALNRAIEYLHTPVEERSDYTRASYAMTELRLPGERDGQATAPPSYKFLLERHLAGDYVRFLVLDGVVLNAMYCPNGPWHSSADELEDVSDRVHPTIGEIAVEASRAIPGLALVAVDVIVPSMTQTVTAEVAHIVEFSERPWLATQTELDERLGIELAMEILRFGLKVPSLPTPAREVRVRVRIDGAIDPESFRLACTTEAESLGLQPNLAVTDPVLGHVSGHLQGPPRQIAWMIEMALNSGISGQRAMLAEITEQDFPEAQAAGFVNYSDREIQDLVSSLMAPRALRNADPDYLNDVVQPVLDHVPADRVPHGALRRIERNDLSVRRGLSFKAQIVAMSEAHRLNVLEPSWALDRKNSSYQFLDALGVRHPSSDSRAKKFDLIALEFPSVIKPTRSTGSRGCYLLFSEDRIIHARDNTLLTSPEELRSHAHQLMGLGPRRTSRPLSDRWMSEEMILEDTVSLTPARDFKFYCFYGEIVLMQESRRLPALEVAFWTADNQPTKTGRYEDSEYEGMGIIPMFAETVQKISVAIPFPFMRIDMLNGGNQIVFGEFTPRPGRFEQFNDYWDRRMGEAWVQAESRLTEDFLRGKRFDAFTEATRIIAD